MNTIDTNHILYLENIDTQTFAIILLIAVKEGSEEITWSSENKTLRLGDKSNDLLNAVGANLGEAFILEILTQQAKTFASIGKETPSSGQFLLLIGNHRLTIDVDVDFVETVTLRLIGSKELSAAARDSLLSQSDASKELIITIDNSGFVTRRRRLRSLAVRSNIILKMLILTLLLLLAAGCIAVYSIWILS